jgi:hypothetical protein
VYILCLKIRLLHVMDYMPLSEVAGVCNPDLTIESVELNRTCVFCLLEDVLILPLDRNLKKRVKLGT